MDIPQPLGSTDGYGQSPDQSIDTLWANAVREYLASRTVSELADLLPSGAGMPNEARNRPDNASINPVSQANSVSAAINGKAQQLADLRARTDANGYPIPDNGAANAGVTDTTNMLPNRTV